MRLCPVCGQGVAVSAPNCPTCNTDFSLVSSLNEDIMGSRAAPEPAKQPLKSGETRGQRIKRAAIMSFLWGLGGAAVFAVIGGICMHLLFEDEGKYNQLVGGMDFGSLVGFMLGSIWGAVKALNPGLAMGAVIGAVLGISESLHHHFTEWILIAPPDIGTHMIAIMGFGAGAITGACCTLLHEFREER